MDEILLNFVRNFQSIPKFFHEKFKKITEKLKNKFINNSGLNGYSIKWLKFY